MQFRKVQTFFKSGRGLSRRRDIFSTAVAVGLVIGVFLLLAGGAVFGRAGGGEGFPGSSGGGGGGGGGDDAIFNIIWFLIELSINYPAVGIPLLIVFLSLVAFGAFEGRERYVASTIRRGTKAQGQVEQAKAVARLLSRDKEWNKGSFIFRIRKAFLLIQDAWSKRDLSKAQSFLSDGVFDRFTILLREYKDAGLRDHLQDVKILDAEIKQIETDSIFDTVHVAIRASAVNFRVDAKSGKYAEGPSIPEIFEEVWSFIRRPGVTTLKKPGLIEGYCPNCSAPITIARVGICEVCNSYLRSGEYDWVLSEITQACEWKINENDEIPGLSSFRKIDPGFNAQHIEDRVSVIFWRHVLADRLGDAGPMKKFTLPAYIQELSERFKPASAGARQYFGRCAVGSVEVGAIIPSDQFDRIFAVVAWSGVIMTARPDGKVDAGSKNTRRINNAFIMVRKHGVKTETKASLDSSHCPSCGAPEQDPLEFTCKYCGTVLNDGSQDWTLEKIVSPNDEEVTAAVRQARGLDHPQAVAQTQAPLDPSGSGPFPVSVSVPASSPVPSLGPTLNSRSSAQLLECLVATMLADGVIDPKEMAILKDFGGRNGVPEARIQEVVATLQGKDTGKNTLPLPDTPEEGREILKAMASMALADGRLSDDEFSLLRDFGRKIGLSPLDVKMIVRKERTRLFQEGKQALLEIKKMTKDSPA